MSQISVNLDSDIVAILDASAEFRSLSREDMLREAINEAAEYDRYAKAKIMRGRKDIAEGRFYSSEDVDKRAEARIARTLCQMEKS